MSTPVVLALGSNVGDRLANLRAAVDALPRAGVTVDHMSSVWETEPVPANQPRFLNAALTGSTSLTPAELLGAVKRIERELGRRPGRRWGPRVIDIDILFYGDSEVATEDLTIPHPRIAERSFVLAPLEELLTGPLPVIGSTATDLLDHIGRDGIARTGLSLRAPQKFVSRESPQTQG